MRSIKTQGIVIKRMELGETDRLLTIFTYDLGKIRALAKGSRKPLSRLAGHLEPFSLTECQLHEGRTFYYITGAEVRETFSDIRDDLQRTGLACYFLEMVDTLTVDLQSQSTVFELLQESLVLLGSQERVDNVRLLRAAFTLKLLADLGYLPELSHCVNCHRLLQPRGNVFSVRLGGVLGPECATADAAATHISPDAIKVMRLLLTQSMGVVNRLTLGKLVLDELESVTESYLHYHVGRPLYSAGFMDDAKPLS